MFRQSFAQMNLSEIFGKAILLAVCFIRNEVAREDFKDVFGGSDHRCHVETDMDGSRQQALPLDFVTSQAKRENSTNNWDWLNHSLRDLPATCSNNSSCYTHRIHIKSRLTEIANHFGVRRPGAALVRMKAEG